jgi:hypothetical protein
MRSYDEVQRLLQDELRRFREESVNLPDDVGQDAENVFNDAIARCAPSEHRYYSAGGHRYYSADRIYEEVHLKVDVVVGKTAGRNNNWMFMNWSSRAECSIAPINLKYLWGFLREPREQKHSLAPETVEASQGQKRRASASSQAPPPQRRRKRVVFSQEAQASESSRVAPSGSTLPGAGSSNMAKHATVETARFASLGIKNASNRQLKDVLGRMAVRLWADLTAQLPNIQFGDDTLESTTGCDVIAMSKVPENPTKQATRKTKIPNSSITSILKPSPALNQGTPDPSQIQVPARAEDITRSRPRKTPDARSPQASNPTTPTSKGPPVGLLSVTPTLTREDKRALRNKYRDEIERGIRAKPVPLIILVGNNSKGQNEADPSPETQAVTFPLIEEARKQQDESFRWILSSLNPIWGTQSESDHHYAWMLVDHCGKEFAQ